jgi:hypothetical protein
MQLSERAFGIQEVRNNTEPTMKALHLQIQIDDRMPAASPIHPPDAQNAVPAPLTRSPKIAKASLTIPAVS